MSSVSDAVIRIRGLVKRLQRKEVLRGVDLDVPRGAVMVVLGRSGCGKSVLLKHIAGLMKPDAGVIEVNGVDTTCLDPLEFPSKGVRISMLFQNSALFDSLTVRENVGFYLDHHTALPEEAKAAKVREKLALVDLQGIEGLKPFQLSGGMQKRVALARALMMEPDVMLYDEPTTGLDPITAEAINRTILELNGRFGMTSLVVTHDLGSAFKIADRVAMLHEGRVVFEGTPEELRSSTDPYVRRFLSGGEEDDWRVGKEV